MPSISGRGPPQPCKLPSPVQEPPSTAVSRATRAPSARGPHTRLLHATTPPPDTNGTEPPLASGTTRLVFTSSCCPRPYAGTSSIGCAGADQDLCAKTNGCHPRPCHYCVLFHPWMLHHIYPSRLTAKPREKLAACRVRMRGAL
jgi:hypothetical protein